MDKVRYIFKGVIIIKNLKLFSILITIVIVASSCSSIFGSDNLSDVNTSSKITNISNENNLEENSKEVINENGTRHGDVSSVLVFS